MGASEVGTHSISGGIDLYIVGAGVSFPEHLSIETVEALGKCNAIRTNLPEEHLSLLPADLRAKCKSLWSFYKDRRRRSDNYQDVVEEVMRVAETEKPTAWLTPGHPVIFDSVTTALVSRGRAKGGRYRCCRPFLASTQFLTKWSTIRPAGFSYMRPPAWSADRSQYRPIPPFSSCNPRSSTSITR